MRRLCGGSIKHALGYLFWTGELLRNQTRRHYVDIEWANYALQQCARCVVRVVRSRVVS
jgi:hypothetical protein